MRLDEELSGYSGSGVQFSNDINPLEEDLEETSPLFQNSHRSRQGNSFFNQLMSYFKDDREFTVKEELISI